MVQGPQAGLQPTGSEPFRTQPQPGSGQRFAASCAGVQPCPQRDRLSLLEECNSDASSVLPAYVLRHAAGGRRHTRQVLQDLPPARRLVKTRRFFKVTSCLEFATLRLILSQNIPTCAALPYPAADISSSALK